MPTNVIMPALGMAQETGTLVRWLKRAGASVTKGESLAEVMTDKATVELDAPADGVLGQLLVEEGAEVPVGQVIALVFGAGEEVTGTPPQPETASQAPAAPSRPASPLAARLAAEHQLDLAAIPAQGKRIEKADVLAYLGSRPQAAAVGITSAQTDRQANGTRLRAASPKARRLAAESRQDLASIAGSGPFGAVLAADVLMASRAGAAIMSPAQAAPADGASETRTAVGAIWRIMAERTTQSWTQVPHFFLLREVDASRLASWREQLQKDASDQTGGFTYTDLLVKLVAVTLRSHPHVNSSWEGGRIVTHREVNVGLAVATKDGLVVPVLHRADALSLAGIAQQRADLVRRAQAGKLRPEDLAGGTFTISNLGMYGVDAFNAIIVAPQAAILAVGRIADRVIPVRGVPAVRPIMALSLSCDHRVVDGARGAQFLGALADVIEEPLALLADSVGE